MRKTLLQLGIALLLPITALAADECASPAPTVVAPCVAQLTNGYTIRHVKREVDGTNVRLYMNGAGYTEIPAALVATYEPDLTPAPAPPIAPQQVAQTPPPPPKSLDDHIAAASSNTGIDPDFIRSVIKAESGSNPKAVSRKGAQGLMQLMPQTAAKLGVKDAFNPEENVNGGTQFLRELLVKYNGDAIKALAAYNAGPHRVAQYKGVPPYRETRHYVASIIRDYNKRKAAEKKTSDLRRRTAAKNQ